MSSLESESQTASLCCGACSWWGSGDWQSLRFCFFSLSSRQQLTPLPPVHPPSCLSSFQGQCCCIAIVWGSIALARACRALSLHARGHLRASTQLLHQPGACSLKRTAINKGTQVCGKANAPLHRAHEDPAASSAVLESCDTWGSDGQEGYQPGLHKGCSYLIAH